MRSLRNYPHQLAERLGARLVDLTVSGATTANIVDTPQQVADGSVYPPQLEGVPSGADVVTVTAGGNDLGFIAALLSLAWARTDPASPIVALLEALAPEGIPRLSESRVADAADGLVHVVEGVRATAPSARILLVDYLHVLDRSSSTASPFSDDEVSQFLEVQRAIDQLFCDAGARSGAEVVSASSLSAGHTLGSAEPWVQPFIPVLTETAGSFHPNEVGMRAIATELERVLSA
jgi:lysophospholipase L1-like esterase